MRKGKTKSGRGFEEAEGAWLGKPRLSGRVPRQLNGTIDPLIFPRRGISFSLANATQPLQGRHAGQGLPSIDHGGGSSAERRGEGRFYRRARLSTSKTVMSVIDQLEPVIKAQKMRTRLGNFRSSWY